MGQRHNSAVPDHPHVTKRGGSPKDWAECACVRESESEDAAGRADIRVNGGGEHVGDEMKHSSSPLLQFTIFKLGLLCFPLDNNTGHCTSLLICSQQLS